MQLLVSDNECEKIRLRKCVMLKQSQTCAHTLMHRHVCANTIILSYFSNYRDNTVYRDNFGPDNCTMRFSHQDMPEGRQRFSKWVNNVLIRYNCEMLHAYKDAAWWGNICYNNRQTTYVNTYKWTAWTHMRGQSNQPTKTRRKKTQWYNVYSPKSTLLMSQSESCRHD